MTERETTAAGKIQAMQRGRQGRRRVAETKQGRAKQAAQRQRAEEEEVQENPSAAPVSSVPFAKTHQKAICVLQASRLVHTVAQHYLKRLQNADSEVDEQAMHELALTNANKPDSQPPEQYVKQKQRRSVWKKMVAKVTGEHQPHLPPAIHLRHFATRRAISNGAMLLTAEVMEMVNVERLLDPVFWPSDSPDQKGYCTLALDGNETKGGLHMFSKIQTDSEEPIRTPWSDTAKLEVSNMEQQKLTGWIALDDPNSRREKRIGTFELSMNVLKDGVCTDHWVPITRTPAVLHLKATLFRDDGKLKLMVDIMDAFGLENTDDSGLSDPYCKVSLGPNQSARTKAVDHDLTPEWNETFSFDVDEAQLLAGQHPPLLAVVMDQDLMKDDVMASFSLDIAKNVGTSDGEGPQEFFLDSADISAINAAIKSMKNKKLSAAAAAAATTAESNVSVDAGALAMIANAEKKPSRWSRLFGKHKAPGQEQRAAMTAEERAADTVLRAFAPKPSPLKALLQRQKLNLAQVADEAQPLMEPESESQGTDLQLTRSNVSAPTTEPESTGPGP
eukprot:SAG31_NODE_3656_length_4020_cov_2.852079_4_plen_560_part_00